MNRRPLTPEEQRLWDQVTRHDAPLRASERAEAPPAPARPRVDPMRREFRMPFSDAPQPPLERGTYANIDRNTATKFRKGEYPIDGTLDLHGMTREKAHRALIGFLRGHCERGSRCLLVVTGKGTRAAEQPEPRGVLRDLLPQWLAEPGLRPMVLAFDMAQPKHGGGGAYYLLLRRRR